MSAILVTGIAGFIGMSVAKRLLERGETIVGVDNVNDYYDVKLKRDRIALLEALGENRFHFVEQDFANGTGLAETLRPQSFDRIVHLGAQPGVRYSIDHPHAYSQSNLVGHLNMLELGRSAGVQHLVYASSSSVYGNGEQQPLSVDQRVDHPISLYAATKKANELMSESYAHLYRLPLTGLRFFTVYGPWGRPDMAIWDFTRRILAGEPIPIFNHGEMKRDFTYIDDIVTGLIACLDNPPADDGKPKAGGSVSPHRIYNIGNNKPEKLMHMVELIEEACGCKAEYHFLPMQAGDVHETYADIDAIHREMGYNPTTSIDVGIPRFVSWYKDYTGRA